MLFNSIEFLIFFPLVLLGYYIIPRRGKHLWLLAASYYFYMSWNARYALLILFSTVVTYGSSLVIAGLRPQKAGVSEGDREQEKTVPGSKAEPNVGRKAELVVAGCIVVNLAILFFFKYFNFTLELLTSVFGMIGMELHMPVFDVVLPVGISFYTFQALSYTIDVYRGDVEVERDFFRYALFVSFFPQLVAGPIERSKNLITQLKTPQKFNFERARDGFLLMLWGYFLKVVLAERITIYVDTVYGGMDEHPGMFLIVATVLFAVQIYCDFAGYSIIAMGAAEILGIRLMENFDAPYLSLTVAEFWRHWHISLTSWFRDYIYFPLGGSRKGKVRKYVNQMIVFLVSGLWHGADLSFVVWGGLNGFYQVMGDLLQPMRERIAKWFGIHPDSIGHKFVKLLVTFVLVDFSWIFFRASSIRLALHAVKSMLLTHNPWILTDGSLFTCGLDRPDFTLMLLCIAVLLFADICKRRGIVLRKVIAAQDTWCRCLTIAAAICFILLCGIWGPGYNAGGFIYFQF